MLNSSMLLVSLAISFAFKVDYNNYHDFNDYSNYHDFNDYNNYHDFNDYSNYNGNLDIYHVDDSYSYDNIFYEEYNEVYNEKIKVNNENNNNENNNVTHNLQDGNNNIKFEVEDDRRDYEDESPEDLMTMMERRNDEKERGKGAILVTKRYTRFQDSSISYCIGLCQYTHRVDYSACYDVCTWNGRHPSPWKDFMRNLNEMQPAGKKLSAKDSWYPFRWSKNRNRPNKSNDRGPTTTTSKNDRSTHKYEQTRPKHRNRDDVVHYFRQ